MLPHVVPVAQAQQTKCGPRNGNPNVYLGQLMADTMPNTVIVAGSRVLVGSADGRQLPKIATTGVVDGYDFLVVWVCREEEWHAALREGRTPDALPWPADAVAPLQGQVSHPANL